ATGLIAPVVRQAVRPGLAGDDRVGQEEPAARTAGRRGGEDRGEVPGGARPAGGALPFGSWLTDLTAPAWRGRGGIRRAFSRGRGGLRGGGWSGAPPRARS